MVENIAFCKTANEMYCNIFQKLETYGRKEQGRNGAIKELTHVCMSIADPIQRWVESRIPVISPAFAIAELIMIMNGCDDAYLLNTWNPALPKFQGNYDKYPGAYGKRLKYSFGFDQINRAYEALSSNPGSRQIVLEIWKPDIDLPINAGQPNNDDIPCNICSLLKIRQGKLLWTQIMRSNDIVYGLPYNLIQFTSMQEIMAGWLKIKPGEYLHISDSLHMYDNINCAVDLDKPTHLNTDRLDLLKRDSDVVFDELLIRMKELASKKCTESYIKEIIIKKNLPDAYHNMMLLLCEYIAYQQNMSQDLICECEQSNSNVLYCDLMHSWMENKRRLRGEYTGS